MKRLLIVILTVCCACALAVGSAAFAADSSGSYAAAFDKVSSDSNTSGMEISQNGEDITDGVLIPAGSVKLACDDASNGVTNLFLTKSKAVNMEKPVYIKWRENFTGDMAQYYIGLGTDSKMANVPTSAEFSFCQTWGSVANGSGTMKSSFYSEGRAVGAWDLGTGNQTLARGAWHFYQLKIAYNGETASYDVTMSFEGHDGSSKTTLASYSIPMEKITGGAYLFFWGTSHPTAAPSIYLVNDTRSDHLAGTSFADWYHSAEVTTTEEFEAALADTSVNSIDCIITDAFKYVPGEHVITRSLTIRSRDAAGNRYNGTAGLTFEEPLVVRGDIDFAMDGGCATLVIDGARANLAVVSMGNNPSGLDENKPDHCIVVKNGGEAVSEWSSLDLSAKGAVRLENGSKFTVVGNAAQIYTLTSQVAVDIQYPGIIPSVFCDNKNVANIYAVMIGEGNQLLGLEDIQPALVTYETEAHGTFFIQYSPIQSFTFDKTSVEVAVGASVSGALTATVPEAPTNLTAFAYSVADEEIAEVISINQGLGFKVTGKKAGSTELVIRTTDRLNEADAVVVRIPVVVSAPTLSGIRLDASGVKTELAFGEEPDLSGLAVYAVYTDGSEKPLSASEYTVDRGGFAADQAGEYVFTVTYGTAEPQSFTVKLLEKSGCGSALSAGSAVGLAILAAALVFVRKRRVH